MHFLHEADTGGESHVVVLEIVRPLASVLVDFFGVDLHFFMGRGKIPAWMAFWDGYTGQYRFEL